MSTPDTPPATVQEERSRHGWLWKLNTVSGIICYSLATALFCVLYLGMTFDGFSGKADVSEQALLTLCLFLSFILTWILLLIPGLLLRLVWGGVSGQAGGLTAALLSFVMLTALHITAGIPVRGSLMLYIFIHGPYKLASSHFGLRSLGIPLDLPEWRAMKRRASEGDKSGGFSFSLFYRGLYWVAAAGLTGGLFSFCFDDDEVLNASVATAAVLLPAWWAARPCLSALTRTITSYKNEKPEQSLCYALLWILMGAGWSGLLLGMLRLLIDSSDWNRHMVYRWGDAAFFFSSLAAVGLAQALIAFFRHLMQRYPRVRHIETPDSPVSSMQGWIAVPIAVLAVGALFGSMAYIQELQRRPYKHTLTELRLFAPQQYQTEAKDRQLPDVDVVPSFVATPTPEQQRMATVIASSFLQDKGHKYVRRTKSYTQTFGQKEGSIIELFLENFGQDTHLISLCYALLSDVPQEQRFALQERLYTLSDSELTHPASTDASARLLLKDILEVMALHRFEHPAASRTIGVKPCNRIRFHQLNEQLKEAIERRDVAAMARLIDEGAYVETLCRMTISERRVRSSSSIFPVSNTRDTTVLQTCLRNGFEEGTRLLLEKGASVHHGTRDFRTCRDALEQATDTQAKDRLSELLRQYGV